MHRQLGDADAGPLQQFFLEEEIPARGHSGPNAEGELLDELSPGINREAWQVEGVMSLVQSAKLNGHDPWAYLRDVLERLPSHPKQPHRRATAAPLVEARRLFCKRRSSLQTAF
jgi:hypothetical protein